mgnify:FL=1
MLSYLALRNKIDANFLAFNFHKHINSKKLKKALSKTSAQTKSLLFHSSQEMMQFSLEQFI